jgi:hypothetical protein
MQMAGGGWTLGFMKNSRHTGHIQGFGSGNRSLPTLVSNPTVSSSSNDGRLGWLDLNDFSYTELRLAAYHNGSRTYLSNAIQKTQLRIRFGQDGYLLYGQAGYYWCGGRRSFTDSGQGQINRPAGAPADCKGHGGLGSGWDFGPSGTNSGLTLCGNESARWMHVRYGSTTLNLGTTGGAQAIWVR